MLLFYSVCKRFGHVLGLIFVRFLNMQWCMQLGNELEHSHCLVATSSNSNNIHAGGSTPGSMSCAAGSTPPGSSTPGSSTPSSMPQPPHSSPHQGKLLKLLRD